MEGGTVRVAFADGSNAGTRDGVLFVRIEIVDRESSEELPSDSEDPFADFLTGKEGVELELTREYVFTTPVDCPGAEPPGTRLLEDLRGTSGRGAPAVFALRGFRNSCIWCILRG